MALRLRNDKDPELTLSITNETWFGLLDLAEEHGWNPMGTVLPGDWIDFEFDFNGYDLFGNGHWHNGYDEERRLVLIEDALNLADALDRAFMVYEPAYVPASFFYFEPLDPALRLQPSIGAIAEVTDFCRYGAFWIERYERSE